MARGRKPYDTVTVYRYGVVRLPANYPKRRSQRLVAHHKAGVLTIGPAIGEPGYKPIFGTSAVSGVLNLTRLFRFWGLDPAKLAGEYQPKIRNGVLSIHFS